MVIKLYTVCADENYEYAREALRELEEKGCEVKVFIVPQMVSEILYIPYIYADGAGPFSGLESILEFIEDTKAQLNLI